MHLDLTKMDPFQTSFDFNPRHKGRCDLCLDDVTVLIDISQDGDGSCMCCGDCLVPELYGDADVSSIDPLAEIYSPELAEVSRKRAEPPTSMVKDTNPKTIYGKAKPAISLIPATSLVHIADAFGDGAAKYGPANWRNDPVSVTTYADAALRHLFAWFDGEETAEDSGVHHLAHAAACLCIIMDAQEQRSLVDDRPTAGRTSAVLKRLTKKL